MMLRVLYVAARLAVAVEVAADRIVAWWAAAALELPPRDPEGRP
jgi:hypothetical protein